MNDKDYRIIKEEREESNRLYAIKLVEKIVFALVSLICVAAVMAMFKLIFI